MLRLLAVLILLGSVVPRGQTAIFARVRLRSSTSSALALRKRLHVDPLITDPGTAEIDWSSLYSLSTTSFNMPSAIKVTAEGSFSGS